MNSPAPYWPYPRLIAHRGAGLAAPENTLAAMRAGARHGYAMVEYDVKLTRDGLPVLLHDDEVDRTSNGHGRACELDFNDLAALDFGAWHSPRYAGEPLATLYSVAAFTQANAMYSNIEIKPSPGLEVQTGQSVARLAASLWRDPAAPPLLSSFSEAALQAALQTAPQLPRALLIEEAVPPDWPERLARLQCVALNARGDHLSAGLIARVKAKGYKITAWVINDPAPIKQLLGWGCDAVFTDSVATIDPQLF